MRSASWQNPCSLKHRLSERLPDGRASKIVGVKRRKASENPTTRLKGLGITPLKPLLSQRFCLGIAVPSFPNKGGDCPQVRTVCEEGHGNHPFLRHETHTRLRVLSDSSNRPNQRRLFWGFELYRFRRSYQTAATSCLKLRAPVLRSGVPRFRQILPCGFALFVGPSLVGSLTLRRHS